MGYGGSRADAGEHLGGTSDGERSVFRIPGSENCVSAPNRDAAQLNLVYWKSFEKLVRIVGPVGRRDTAQTFGSRLVVLLFRALHDRGSV
jgi:hypothetical protein